MDDKISAILNDFQAETAAAAVPQTADAERLRLMPESENREILKQDVLAALLRFQKRSGNRARASIHHIEPENGRKGHYVWITSENIENGN